MNKDREASDANCPPDYSARYRARPLAIRPPWQERPLPYLHERTLPITLERIRINGTLRCAAQAFREATPGRTHRVAARAAALHGRRGGGRRAGAVRRSHEGAVPPGRSGHRHDQSGDPGLECDARVAFEAWIS